MINFCVVNQCSVVPAAEVEQAVAAQQIQADRDFTPAWGPAVKFRLVGDPAAVEAGEWPVHLVDHDTDVPDALDWHTVQGATPTAVIPVALDLQYGDHWQSSLSHEWLEAACDPDCNRIVLGMFGRHLREIAFEVADPVENYEYTIAVGGVNVPVSDFVLPAWWRQSGAGPVDLMHQLSYPLTLGKGGYVSYYAGGQWHDLFGRHAPAHQHTPRRFSRRWKRRQHLQTLLRAS